MKKQCSQIQTPSLSHHIVCISLADARVLCKSYNVPRSQKDPKSAKAARRLFLCALIDAGVLPQTLYRLVSFKTLGFVRRTKGVSGSRIRPSLPNAQVSPGPPRANGHLSRCQGTGSGGLPTGSGHGILGGNLGKSGRRQQSCGKRKNKKGLRGR